MICIIIIVILFIAMFLFYKNVYGQIKHKSTRQSGNGDNYKYDEI